MEFLHYRSDLTNVLLVQLFIGHTKHYLLIKEADNVNVIPGEGFLKDACRGPISINPLKDKMENDNGLGVDLRSHQHLESALDDDRFVANRHKRRGGDCTSSSLYPVVQTL